MKEENTKPSGLKLWIRAVRAFSFPASMVPAVLGIMLVLNLSPENASWWLIPFILISLLLLHAASNLINDHDDFKKGVDATGSFGGSGVLVQGLMLPGQIFRGAIFLFILALIFGLPIIFERGIIILLFGILGILGGFFYTSKPLGYKYYALGDIFIFLLYGPAIVVGTYYALTGNYSSTALLTSIPLGLLVTGILQANNLRDLLYDRKAKIKTLATIFGEGFAKGEYLFLILGAYAVVVTLVILKVLTPWSLLVLLSLPPAIKNLNAIKGIKINETSKIVMLDAQTAQLTLLFGLLLSISILISKYL